MRSHVRLSLVVALVAGIAVPGLARAQAAKSTASASELVKLMSERKLDAYALEDPARPGYFVAVRDYPGVQLLLVEARSTSADYMKAQIAQQQYGEAYLALNSSAVPETKVFFQDMGCNGLRRDGDDGDVMYEQAVHQTRFDGKGKASGLSKSDYATKVENADARYAAIATLLLNGLRAASTATSGGA